MCEAALAGNSSRHGKDLRVVSDYVVILFEAQIIIHNSCSCISS